MAKPGEIVRRLLSRTDEPTAELINQLHRILAPDPGRAQLESSALASALRAGREEAIAALLAGLPLEQVAGVLGTGDEARAHAAAVLNAPFSPRTPLSAEYLDAQTARIQALEECVRLLAFALGEVLHPSPREAAPGIHSTAGRRR